MWKANGRKKGQRDSVSNAITKHCCMGMWLSNGLHHLWCGAGQCYSVSEDCACTFCGCAGVDKFHLLRCEWASCEQMNMDNIQQIVKVLHACNRHT